MSNNCEESFQIPEIDNTENDDSSFSPSTKSSVHKRKPGLNISCEKCGKYFRYRWSLNLHSREHENKVNFKCTECPAKYISNSDLNKHLVSHSTERPFKCSYCPTYCKTKVSKLRHEDTHDMTTYNCRYCEATFKRYFNKTIHERSHKCKEPKILNEETGETQYKCLICYSLFSSPYFLKEHTKSKHVPSDKVETINEENGAVKYKCRLCNDIDLFVDLDILMNHIKIHKEKYSTTSSQENTKCHSLKCSICSLKFTKSKELRKHAENKHPNDWRKMFSKECPICDKYITQSYLPFHIRLHKGLRPFKCNNCEAAFSCKSDLTKHTARSCSYKRIIQCYWCKEIVSSKEEKDAHMKLHLGGKRHKCDKCDATFYHSGTLYAHKCKMHVKKMKECHICKKQILSIQLKAHIKKKHEKNEKLCDHCGKTFLNEHKFKAHYYQVVKWQRFRRPNVDNSCESETIHAHIHNKELHQDKKILNKPFLLINFDIESIQQIILSETAIYAECNICGYISYSRHKVHSHLHFEKFVMKHRGISTSNEIIKNIDTIPVTCPNDKNNVSKKAFENIPVFRPPEIIFRPDGGMIRIKPTYESTSWIYSLKIPKQPLNKTKTNVKYKANSKLRRIHPSTIRQSGKSKTCINTALGLHIKPTTNLQQSSSTTVKASKKNYYVESDIQKKVMRNCAEPRLDQSFNRPIRPTKSICKQGKADSNFTKLELIKCSLQTEPAPNDAESWPIQCFNGSTTGSISNQENFDSNIAEIELNSCSLQTVLMPNDDAESRTNQSFIKPITNSGLCNQANSNLTELKSNSCSLQSIPYNSPPIIEKNISAYSATSYLCRKCSRSNNVSSQPKNFFKKDQIMLQKCGYCDTINKFVLYSMKLPIWPTSNCNENGCRPSNKSIPIFFMNSTVQSSRIASFKQNNHQLNRVLQKQIDTINDASVLKNLSYLKKLSQTEMPQFVSRSTNDCLGLNLSENIASEMHGLLSIKELEKLHGCDVDTLLNYLKGK